MPTIKRFAGCKLSVYGPDHGPPHFHIVGPDFSALVEIATLRVIEGDVRRAADAMAWASENRDVLLNAWNALNPGRR